MKKTSESKSLLGNTIRKVYEENGLTLIIEDIRNSSYAIKGLSGTRTSSVSRNYEVFKEGVMVFKKEGTNKTIPWIKKFIIRKFS